MKYILILFWFLFVEVAFAGRGIDADFIKSTDHTKTWNFPAGSDALVGRTSTDTLQNKTISGLLNTITNVDLTTAVTGTLPIANGGTGQTTAANAINALLPTQTSNSGKYLTTDGSVASWGTISGTGDVSGPSSSVDSEIALFSSTTGKVIKRATGTGFVKVSSGVMQTPASTVSLTTEVSGTLPVGNGGTGASTLTANNVILGNGTSAVQFVAPSTSGNVLTSNGTTWASSPGLTNPMTTSGDVIYGAASGTPTRLAKGTDGQYLRLASGIPAWQTPTLPTVQIFTSGSGTYTLPTNAKLIRVRMVGGGGGGSGSGSAGGTAAGDGGDTTFGTLTAGKGLKGVWNAGGSAGGSVTIGAGWTDVASSAGAGSFGFMQVASGGNLAPGGAPGASRLAGMQPLNPYSSAGAAGGTNTGNGGQGGGGNNAAGSDAGTGGSSGAYVEAITSGAPSSTYSYAVGAGGTAGGAGTSGLAGGAGGSGKIIVEEYY